MATTISISDKASMELNKNRISSSETINEILIEGHDWHEFGFEVDLKNALSRTRNWLKNKKFVSSMHYLWKSIQDRLQSHKAQFNENDPLLHEYVTWFLSLSLPVLPHPLQKYASFYHHLWSIGQQPLTLEQLQDILYEVKSR